MKSSRSILSATMTFLGATVLSRANSPVQHTQSPTSKGPAKNSGATQPLRKIGLIANEPRAAGANTAAMISFVAPGGTCKGRLSFPNDTGADTYYFNDIIPFNDGIQLDLQGCTLHFKKNGDRKDTNAGFIFAMRDFSIANGSISVDYQPGGGASSAGNALTFGNRGADSLYFSPTYDSLLPSPLGNIEVRNLRISSNARGGSGILMIGGLNGVLVENVWIDGKGRMDNGICYEFGWATNEAKRALRQTSHAYNMRFSNINISNLSADAGQALTLAGAYNCWVDGLYVRSTKILFACTPGESAFYRPWKGVDQVGAKHNIAVRNIVGSEITGTAIGIAGASSKAGGYLRETGNTAKDETDLMDISIDGFAIDGSAGDGYGIHSSAGKLDLRNGRITNFSRGVVTTHECTRMVIDSVDVFGCKESGMQIGQPSSIWNPPRQKMGFIRNCVVAGNSVAAPGSFAGIELDLCATFVVEGNRFGYEVAHDGLPETTQGYSIRVGTQANNVVCRCNHTGGVLAGGAAYSNLSSGSSQGNIVEKASGLASTLGPWDEPSRKR
jgi:hypothetical protein